MSHLTLGVLWLLALLAVELSLAVLVAVRSVPACAACP
jgi:hypothetical protein